MSKEIKSLLERIISFGAKRAEVHFSFAKEKTRRFSKEEDYAPMFFTEDYKAYVSILDDATTALEVLKQQPTALDFAINCGTMGKGDDSCCGCIYWVDGKLLCNDCGTEYFLVEQQPPVGEFTANMRSLIGYFGHLSNKYSLEVCDRLDTSEAENRELKAADKTHLSAFSGLQERYLQLKTKLDTSEAENKRLKKAIEDYGNNPAGFDWAVLEKIEIQETINADLLATCEEFMKFANKDLPKDFNAPMSWVDKLKDVAFNIEVVIAKAKKEG